MARKIPVTTVTTVTTVTIVPTVTLFSRSSLLGLEEKKKYIYIEKLHRIFFRAIQEENFPKTLSQGWRVKTHFFCFFVFVSWITSLNANGINLSEKITWLTSFATLSSDKRQVTGERWQVTRDNKKKIFFNIGATICTRWEIQRVPNARLLTRQLC